MVAGPLGVAGTQNLLPVVARAAGIRTPPGILPSVYEIINQSINQSINLKLSLILRLPYPHTSFLPSSLPYQQKNRRLILTTLGLCQFEAHE